MTCLFLLVIPFLSILISQGKVSALGLQLGDWKFGLLSIALITPLFVVAIVLGSGDASYKALYPLPGGEIQNDTMLFARWVGWYAIFYLSFEFFYRGFLLMGIDELDWETAFLMQLFCCVLIHVGKPFTETLASVPASILFAYVTLRTRSIWYAFVIHLCVGITNDICCFD